VERRRVRSGTEGVPFVSEGRSDLFCGVDTCSTRQRTITWEECSMDRRRRTRSAQRTATFGGKTEQNAIRLSLRLPSSSCLCESAGHTIHNKERRTMLRTREEWRSGWTHGIVATAGGVAARRTPGVYTGATSPARSSESARGRRPVTRGGPDRRSRSTRSTATLSLTTGRAVGICQCVCLRSGSKAGAETIPVSPRIKAPA
jgi:hypothetical protein